MHRKLGMLHATIYHSGIKWHMYGSLALPFRQHAWIYIADGHFKVNLTKWYFLVCTLHTAHYTFGPLLNAHTYMHVDPYFMFELWANCDNGILVSCETTVNESFRSLALFLSFTRYFSLSQSLDSCCYLFFGSFVLATCLPGPYNC